MLSTLDLVVLFFDSGHLFRQNYTVLGQVTYLGGGQELSSYEICSCLGWDAFAWRSKHWHSPTVLLLLKLMGVLLWLLGDFCHHSFCRIEWSWSLLLRRFLFIRTLLHGLLTSSSSFCCSIQKLIRGRLWLIDVIQIADVFL